MAKRLLFLILLTAGLGPYNIDDAAASSINHMLTGNRSQAHKAIEADLPENPTPNQIDAIVARLSDDQVRRLLITELQTSAADTNDPALQADDDGVGVELFEEMESSTGIAHRRLRSMLSNITHIPSDIAHALARLSDREGYSGLPLMVIFILVIFATGLGVERFFKHTTGEFRRQIKSAPEMDGLLKFWSAILKMLPEIIDIFIFALSSFVLFLIIYGVGSSGRPFFLACLIGIVFYRLSSLVSRMLFSPAIPRLRLIPLSDPSAQYLHHRMISLIGITVLAYMTTMLLERLEIPRDTNVWITFFFVTLLLGAIGHMVWQKRHEVGETISGKDSGAADSTLWLRERFAAVWHILSIIYLFVVWLLWIGRMTLVQDATGGDTFWSSILIVPLYLILDRAGQWVIQNTVGTLKSSAAPPPEAVAGEQEETGTDEDLNSSYIRVARKIVRVIIFFTLLFWLLDSWGLRIPFGRALINASFDVFVTLVLAHILWGIISGFIEKKLKEAMPDEADAGAEEDEWGGAAKRGRSYTLLPLLQKFIGTVLIVMVAMIILSSIGVDIGPLLAGAGVVGIAIGFGAQKLVSDILSGVFFLIDDAFRVGEYIKAGSISGMVEEITLRTVKLRHHRGMLQFVTFGDLGSVTNYMRGGVVVKFNLEFAYDTDIEKVRKVIKKVGKKMLEDEEFAEDFIKPLKSQGVRNVGDSVMTIRAKFTAHPGTHFVIRREAYRRITEALNAKGIFYAHKKVIVDLPDSVIPAIQENPDLALKAAAAAAHSAMAGKEDAESSTDKKKE